MKILVLYYSLYGHVYQMARAVLKGIEQVEGVKGVLKKVPETLSEEVLTKMNALEFKQKQENVPICTVEELADYQGIIFGTPTRFGNMCAQMRQFLDATGKLWAKGSLIGKVGSVFVSTATQHGGQESTILNFHTTLLHHGMIIVGLPYSFQEQMGLEEIMGCSPYGASTIAGGDGSRWPSDKELAGATFQGSYVAKITKKLFS